VRFIEFIGAALTIAKRELKKRKGEKDEKKCFMKHFPERIPRWHPLQTDSSRKIPSNRFLNFTNPPGSS
jgi:hypothetical protein